MTFERKIAASLPAENKPPQLEPNPQTQSTTIEVLGGEKELRGRGHKDWGHVIAHNFENRSITNTTVYRGSVAGDLAIDPGAFAYNIVRAVGPLNVTLTAPTAVPDDQLTPSGKRRYRERISFLDIFYAVDTYVTFGPGCIFGRSGYNQIASDFVDLEGNESVVYELVPMLLDEELAGPTVDGVQILRKAGTSDVLQISYNERTAQAVVSPFSIGNVGAADPVNPVDDGTQPGDNDPDETPPDDGTGGYTDPETGEVLPVVRPTKADGVLYALHSLSVSRSNDCGATWRNFPLNTSFGESPVDIVAGRIGVFVLTSAGNVYYARTLEEGFTDLKVGQPAADMEIPLKNADFEVGSILEWTHQEGTEPTVLSTVYPPQRPGSFYYLSQDWSVAAPEPFKIYQNVSIPAEFRTRERLNLSFDAIVAAGDMAKVEVYGLLGNEDSADIRNNLTIQFQDGDYSSDLFATDENGDELNMRMIGKFGDWVEAPFYNGIALGDGTTDEDLRGGLTLRVLKSDGSRFEGETTIEIYDLDTPNADRETLEIEGDFTYEILSNTITVESSSANRVKFLGSPLSLEDFETQPSQLRLTFRGDCDITLSGRLLCGLGMRASDRMGGGEISELLVEAETSENKWVRAKGQYQGPVPARVRVVVQNTGTAGVWIDNVRLTVSEAVVGGDATALAIFDDGADIHLDAAGVINYRPGAPSLQPEETGLQTVFATERGPRGRVAADQQGVSIQLGSTGSWAQFVQGTVSTVIASPDVAVLGSTGAVFGLNGNIGTANPAGRLAGDVRRQLAVSTSPIGQIKLHSWRKSEETMAQQPVKANSGRRGTVPTDVGRYIGWADSSPDIFWAANPQDKWKYGGGIEKGIIKIVEAK